MLQAEIVNREPSRVLGYETRIEPTNADYRAIWEQGFMPHAERIAAQADSGLYFGVYFGTGEPETVEFVAGMSARADATAPEGLVLREIGGGRYAVFTCRMAEIAATWREIYSAWLPGSGHTEDPLRPCIEEYPPGMTGPDSLLKIYVPVVVSG